MEIISNSSENHIFLKDYVENSDLHESMLNKIMATHGECIKHDFGAPLTPGVRCRFV